MGQQNLIPGSYIRVQFSRRTKPSLIEKEQRIANLFTCLFTPQRIAVNLAYKIVISKLLDNAEYLDWESYYIQYL